MIVPADIESGNYDGELDAIQDAVNARRSALQAKASDEFQPGDNVIFNNLCSPRRHVGTRGKVVGPAPRKTRSSPAKVLVKVDGQDRPMTVPPSIIDKLA